MPKRRRLTDQMVRKLKPVAGKQVSYFDTIVPRLKLRLSYGGGDRSRSFELQYYVGGKVRTKVLGHFPAMGVKAARDAARAFQEDPDAALAKSGVGSFGEVADDFMVRYVDKKGLRSRTEIERHLKYAKAKWKDRPFLEIRRLDVNRLLDEIEDKRSDGVANHVLATLRKLFAWFATRSNDYSSPIVAGMRRGKTPTERERKRVLNDDEIRVLWTAWDEVGQFGDFCKVLLLTAQREAKVETMRWDDLSDDGVWTIRTAPREKSNAGAIKLPDAALEIIRRQPRVLGNSYIFAGTRRRRSGETLEPTHISGLSKRKAMFDKLTPTMEPWRLHDLRRTAATLMARAGVRPDIKERALGHTIKGVEGVYDRFAYSHEKADALARLAGLIDLIRYPSDKVIALSGRAIF